jgi:hypothetical protein
MTIRNRSSCAVSVKRNVPVIVTPLLPRSTSGSLWLRYASRSFESRRRHQRPAEVAQWRRLSGAVGDEQVAEALEGGRCASRSAVGYWPRALGNSGRSDRVSTPCAGVAVAVSLVMFDAGRLKIDVKLPVRRIGSIAARC